MGKVGSMNRNFLAMGLFEGELARRRREWEEVRRVRERREVMVAMFFSLALHFLLLWGWSMESNSLQRVGEELEPKAEHEIEVVFLPAKLQENKKFVDSAGLTEVEKAPVDAKFESDRNTQATSEKAGEGPSWLPTVEGKHKEFMEFVETELSLSSGQTAGAAVQPRVGDIVDNVIEKVESLQGKPTERLEQQQPQQEEVELAQFQNGQILLKKEETQEQPKQNRMEVAEQRNRAATAETPARSQVGVGYEPQRRLSKIEGGVSNRGRASVAAVGTPIGRYKKALTDAIGSRWYFYVQQNLSLMTIGTAVIRFYVHPDGRVSGVKVLTNSSSESFASVSIRAILEAEIPPMPPEVAELLESNRIEVDYTFSILAN